MNEIVITIALLLTCFGYVTGASNPAIKFHPAVIAHFEDENGLMEKILLDETNDVVFVGGKNYLYKLDLALNLLGKIATGPVVDGLSCDPAVTTDLCNATEVMNNHVKVLLENPQIPGTLLFCGSVKQGLCAVVNKTAFAELRYLNESHLYNFIGGKLSVTALFGKERTAASNPRSPSVYPLYVAQQYDGRPLELTPEEFSTRYVYHDAATDVIRIDLLHDDPVTGARTARDLERSMKPSYPIRHVASFEDGNFTYYVDVQREDVEYAPGQRDYHYGVHITRVCHNDAYYRSFVEVRLTCVRYPSYRGTADFGIAEDAYFGRIGSEFAYRQGYADKDRVLIVTLGTDVVRGKVRLRTGEPLRQRGSVGCVYPLEMIKERMRMTQHDCYSGRRRPELSPWFFKLFEVDYCRIDMDAMYDVMDNIDFCPVTNATYVNSVIKHSGLKCRAQSNISLTDDYATSVKVVVQDNKTVALQGSIKGHLIKMLIDARPSNSYARIDIGVGLSNATVARDMAITSSHQHAYAMVSQRVVKVSLNTCGWHSTCASCVSARLTDPLGCGWCDGACVTRNQCATPQDWLTTHCPPIIDSFEPRSAPLEGGTLVTVRGRYFTSPDRNDITRSVKLAYRECQVEKVINTTTGIDDIINTTLLCRTQAASDDAEVMGAVSVSVSDHERPLWRSYVVRGKVESSPHMFSFKKAVVTSVHPARGPRSGGTEIRIGGENLDVGSSLRVVIANMPCRVDSERSSGNFVVCVTSPLTGDYASSSRRRRQSGRSRKSHNTATTAETASQALVTADVTVLIDNAVLTSRDALFSYYEDPVISDIYPTQSIASGGTQLTVDGANLDAVHAPRLQLYDPQLKLQYNTSACRLASTSSQRLVCSLPPCWMNATYRPTDTQPITVLISFLMDGVVEMAQFADLHPEMAKFTYHVDPEFFPVGSVRFPTNEIFLDIQGKNLDTVATAADYRVYIGWGLYWDNCPVVVLTSHVLRCRPNAPKTVAADEPERTITVDVGLRLSVDVGTLQYMAPPSSGLFYAKTLLPFVIVSILFFVVVTICAIKRYKLSCRKAHENDNALYRTSDYSDIASNAYMPSGRELQMASLLFGHDGPAVAGAGAVDVTDILPLLTADEERLLLDCRLLIARDRLQLLDVVGQGNFGCVYRGLLQQGEEKEEMTVAVKTLKSLTEAAQTTAAASPGSRHREARQFLDEAMRMREFDHPNILRLVGICLDDSAAEAGQGQQPLVVLPFMQHGDLLAYLRDENRSPNVKELVELGIDIALGMTYLSGLKFVHRDLAARNCMLDEHLRVKVADFGLSRDVYETDYYSCNGRRGRLPVKWMALESLERGIYSTKTDVWSYGVLLWELITRGNVPYPEVGSWEITQFLKPGRRMPQPAYCPDPLYEVMMNCWHPNPRRRQTFSQLVHTIRTIIWTMEELGQQSPDAAPLYDNVPTSQSYLYPQKTPTYDSADEDDRRQSSSTTSDYEPSVSPQQQQQQREEEDMTLDADVAATEWLIGEATAAGNASGQILRHPSMTSRVNRMNSHDSGIAMTWNRSTGIDSVFSGSSVPEMSEMTELRSFSSPHYHRQHEDDAHAQRTPHVIYPTADSSRSMML